MAAALPARWGASACSVSAVIARHHSPASMRVASALPRSNHALRAARGPVIAKNPISRSATTAPTIVMGRDDVVSSRRLVPSQEFSWS